MIQEMKAAPLWDLGRALTTLREIEKFAAEVGFHVALTGSVLYRGESYKDLDVIVYPHHAEEGDPQLMVAAFEQGGFTRVQTIEEVQSGWELYGADSKQVERWQDQEGRRIDLFWLS